jgi:hypothetical protein
MQTKEQISNPSSNRRNPRRTSSPTTRHQAPVRNAEGWASGEKPRSPADRRIGYDMESSEID